jgi:hypothetical protein
MKPEIFHFQANLCPGLVRWYAEPTVLRSDYIMQATLVNNRRVLGLHTLPGQRFA